MRDPTLDAATRVVADRDSARLHNGLSRWLSRHWPAARLLSLQAKAAGGASSELFFLTLSGRPGAPPGVETLVLRAASRWPVYPVENLQVQAGCMSALRRHLPSGLQIPAVYAVETLGADTGAPFMLMQCVSGTAAPDVPSYVLEGWMVDLADSERETLWRRGIEAIAAVHATPVSTAERERFALPCAGGDALQRMLSYWSLFLAHVEQGGSYPGLRAGVAWLQAHRPDGCERDGYVWGDASLRNILFDGNEPCALLDFEFSHVGLSEFDVGFYALMDHMMAYGFAGGAPRLRGFGSMADTFDHYESLSGRTLPHRKFLLLTALTYMALSTTRVYQRLAAQQLIERHVVPGNPPLKYLEAVMAGTATLPH